MTFTQILWWRWYNKVSGRGANLIRRFWCDLQSGSSANSEVHELASQTSKEQWQDLVSLTGCLATASSWCLCVSASFSTSIRREDLPQCDEP